jgi:hypothetical protein
MGQHSSLRKAPSAGSACGLPTWLMNIYLDDNLADKTNDPNRDMKPKHIVGALGKLERSGLALGDDFIVLNHWR